VKEVLFENVVFIWNKGALQPGGVHQGHDFWNQNDSFLNQNDCASKRSIFNI
jgi:hypothetical protein